ncbi:MAG: WGR domain-containing protein [Pseudomonadota bacterium]
MTRLDSPKNIARYYNMSITPDLFGRWVLVRRWGRIGRGGSQLMQSFDEEADAEDVAREILRKKQKRGYEGR